MLEGFKELNPPKEGVKVGGDVMILGTMNLVTVHEKLELEARKETAGIVEDLAGCVETSRAFGW